ncbi:MAG: hypothetical protein V2A76_12860 [Planctomycetota bacterium]
MNISPISNTIIREQLSPKSLPETPGSVEKSVFGEDGFGFGDVLDLVNPLQHIPVVSTIYRAVTDDGIANGPRILGGGLFGAFLGGVGGLISSVFDVGLKESTGRDLGEHVLSWFRDDAPAPPATTRLEALAAYRAQSEELSSRLASS